MAKFQQVDELTFSLNIDVSGEKTVFENTKSRELYKAMCFELATRSVTSPDSENVAPLELQDSLT